MSDQTDFRTALLDASRPVPADLTDPQGRPAGKRFDIYRNNVAVSLTAALETGFPTLRKLVGEEFFKGLASVYLRAHPPRSPILQEYGREMPAFLRSFGPAQSLPYLPDIARLELALRRAYHAADMPAFAPERLARLSPAGLNSARFVFAPSTALIRSAYPIHGIWRFNQSPGAPKPVMAPENALVTRPGYDPIVTGLGPRQAVFTKALMEGQSLSQALIRIEPVPGPFALSDTLATLIQSGAFTTLDS